MKIRRVVTGAGLALVLWCEQSIAAAVTLVWEKTVPGLVGGGQWEPTQFRKSVALSSEGARVYLNTKQSLVALDQVGNQLWSTPWPLPEPADEFVVLPDNSVWFDIGVPENVVAQGTGRILPDGQFAWRAALSIAKPILSRDGDAILYLHEIDQEVDRLSTSNGSEVRIRGPYDSLMGFLGGVDQAGRFLYLGGGGEPVQLRDAGGHLIWARPGGNVGGMTFDGTAIWVDEPLGGGGLMFYDATGQERRRYPEIDSGYSSFAFSPESGLMAAYDRKRQLIVLDARTAMLLWRYALGTPALGTNEGGRNLSQEPGDCVISGGGQSLLFATTDRRLLLFSRAGQLLWETKTGIPLPGLAISGNGQAFVVGDGDMVRYYRVVY